ncbi:MAG: hypothetical protein ACYCVD_03500 [Desulfitobacteriaceae bacterium]
MGLGLAELGNELIQEFDQRQNELESLYSATIMGLKKEREARRQQVKNDQAEQREAQNQLSNSSKEWFLHDWEARRTLSRALQEEKAAGNRELQGWVKDGKNQVKAWRNALRYTHGQRGRR